MLAVRVINADKTSGPNNNFVNSIEVGSVITAPDWDPKPECGNGIHGWLWGMGRSGKNHAGNKIWQVVEVPDDGVNLGGKWKWKWVKVVYSGTQAEAMKLTMEGRQKYITENAALNGSTSGLESSASTSGSESSASTSGFASSASTSGFASSASTSGFASSASTSGLASSASTSGLSSPAVCAGINCKAKAGLYGYIVLGYRVDNHIEYKGARVGLQEGELKPDTWYKLEKGEFVEC